MVIHCDIVLPSRYFSVADRMHEAGQERWGLSQAIN